MNLEADPLPDADALLAPLQGRYEPVSVLGQGAFSTVVKARHMESSAVRAVKVISKKMAEQRMLSKQLEAEIKILRLLRRHPHPFVVGMSEEVDTKDTLYLVLDFVPGGELAGHLRTRRRFPEEDVRIYIAEIALSLGHLHKFGVIYRDLKPENILLDSRGHARLTDFGLSKKVGKGGSSKTFCGSPAYLAPEIVNAAPGGHTRMVDWWSLGVLVYELIVGVPPFYSANLKEMYEKILHGSLRFPRFMSPEARDLVKKLLVRTPGKRLGVMKDVEEIQAHPFFADVDWLKVMSKQYQPKYIPKLEHIETLAKAQQKKRRASKMVVGIDIPATAAMIRRSSAPDPQQMKKLLAGRAVGGAKRDMANMAAANLAERGGGAAASAAPSAGQPLPALFETPAERAAAGNVADSSSEEESDDDDDPMVIPPPPPDKNSDPLPPPPPLPSRMVSAPSDYSEGATETEVRAPPRRPQPPRPQPPPAVSKPAPPPLPPSKPSKPASGAPPVPPLPPQRRPSAPAKRAPPPPPPLPPS